MRAGSRGAERVHPNVILAVLSLAGAVYAVLSSAVIPALPTLQHDLHAARWAARSRQRSSRPPPCAACPR